MRVGRIAYGVRFVSESKLLVMFVTLDGEGTAVNIWERHKME